MTAPSPLYEWGDKRAVGMVYARKHRRDIPSTDLPTDWQGWLGAVFGAYLRPPFADYHREFWEWVWEIEAGQAAKPFVAIWPRSFGKSQSAEAACAAVAALGKRQYVLYVMETQDQADTHVQNVAALLESPEFARHYPAVSRRKIGKYGNSLGWRRQRLRTESGFTLDAIGLDSAARGAKIEGDRPDLIIGDDLDGPLDTELTVKKKITTLTTSILPAGASHAAVMIVQNLIHKDGIVARLADGRADFLTDRIVSGPHPAVAGEPEYSHDGERWHITGGVSTWGAMSLDAIAEIINRIGLAAFLREFQHQIKESEGAIWKLAVIDEHREKQGLPDDISLARVVVGVDPPGSTAECGIVGVGRGMNKRGYVLADRSKRGTPNEWGNAVVATYDDLEADAVVVETNFGGAMVAAVIRSIRPTIKIIEVHASRGKAVRAEPVSAVYEQGRVSHVGHFPMLEDQMCTWVPGQPSPDRMDALVWACSELGLVIEKRRKGFGGS